jgi:hypothetical protein
MFHSALSFDQDLCEWGQYSISNTTGFAYFTSCPEFTNPDFGASPSGPFCHSCGAASSTSGNPVTTEGAVTDATANNTGADPSVVVETDSSTTDSQSTTTTSDPTATAADLNTAVTDPTTNSSATDTAVTDPSTTTVATVTDPSTTVSDPTATDLTTTVTGPTDPNKKNISDATDPTTAVSGDPQMVNLDAGVVGNDTSYVSGLLPVDWGTNSTTNETGPDIPQTMLDMHNNQTSAGQEGNATIISEEPMTDMNGAIGNSSSSSSLSDPATTIIPDGSTNPTSAPGGAQPREPTAVFVGAIEGTSGGSRSRSTNQLGVATLLAVAVFY